MIQAAHVGIGISGMEGLQAACASDYAIAQVCEIFVYVFFYFFTSFGFVSVSLFNQIAFRPWRMELPPNGEINSLFFSQKRLFVHY